MTPRSFALAASLAVAPALVGCGEAAPTDPGMSMRSAASERMFYKVKLAPQGDSRAVGVLLLEVVGGNLTARVHAAGLEPLQRVPQHIHVNPTCANGGGILINLDENLAVAGEAPGVGAAYPMSNQGGVVNYEASRPLSEILAAVNLYSGAGLTTVDELLAWLDLENRNAHMHVSHGPPFPAVNCGEVERMN